MTGDFVKERRQLKHLTQKQLGEMLGFKPEQAQIMVARIEAGTRPIPKSKLVAASKILEVPIEQLL